MHLHTSIYLHSLQNWLKIHPDFRTYVRGPSSSLTILKPIEQAWRILIKFNSAGREIQNCHQRPARHGRGAVCQLRRPRRRQVGSYS